MPRPKNPPAPAAEQAARLVSLLSEPASHGRRAVDVLAAQHRARRRPVKPSPGDVRLPAPRSPSRAVVTGPSCRTYDPDGPTGSRVFDAFLGELRASAVSELRGASVSRFPDARLAMFLFDAARRCLPRMAGALGDPTTALDLLPLVDPSPEGRDPRLYTRAAAKTRGDIGEIARDFEAQRALLAEGRGDRTLARSMLAALAGRLVARAAELLGHQVYADLARALDQANGQRRRAPVRRSELPSVAEPRRPESKTG